MAVQEFFGKLHAIVFDQPGVFFNMAIERHTHLPRSRKNLRVLDRDFVVQSVGTDASITLNDVQGVTVEVARAIEPRLIVETIDVDDERVTLPMANGPSH